LSKILLVIKLWSYKGNISSIQSIKYFKSFLSTDFAINSLFRVAARFNTNDLKYAYKHLYKVLL